jgi:hypothetical protein
VRDKAPIGVISDDQLDRVEHGNAALGSDVEVFTHAVFEHGVVDQRVGARDTNALGKQAEAGWCVATTARTHQCGHAWIVPTVYVVFFDELDQLALG